MKVLLDVNVSNDFRDRLADALGIPGPVVRAHDEGWRTKRNGALQEAASAKGYTCLVTHDKDMAQRHPRTFPYWCWTTRTTGKKDETLTA